MSVNESKMGFPEWREGVWWQVQVRQRALPARTPDPGWTLPNRLLFEVIGEDVVDDKRCYLIRVTYPDRPRVAEHKFADVWISAEERAPVQGTLHIGDRHIPMRYDFLMKLLRTTPMRVNIEGIPRTVLDPRRPEERVELEAFEIRTPTGGVCLSSLAAPFPSRIEEPDYVVELQDWGG